MPYFSQSWASEGDLTVSIMGRTTLVRNVFHMGGFAFAAGVSRPRRRQGNLSISPAERGAGQDAGAAQPALRALRFHAQAAVTDAMANPGKKL